MCGLFEYTVGMALMSNKWPSFLGTFLKAQLQNGPNAEELLAQVFSPKNTNQGSLLLILPTVSFLSAHFW
jgi:hypothetical protein